MKEEFSEYGSDKNDKKNAICFDEEVLKAARMYLGNIGDRIRDKKLLALIRQAVRKGCKDVDEICGYIMNVYTEAEREDKKQKIEFRPYVLKIISEIIDILDKQNEAGKGLVFKVETEHFLINLGCGSRIFADMDYRYVARSIKTTLRSEGVDIYYKTEYSGKYGEKQENFYIIKALTDEDVKIIENENIERRQKSLCRIMAKEICYNKVYNDDNDSVWKDAKFIKDIGGCAFDVNKVEERAKKEKEKLISYNIKNGLRLLFEECD